LDWGDRCCDSEETAEPTCTTPLEEEEVTTAAAAVTASTNLITHII
jgi:hypothetical protein